MEITIILNILLILSMAVVGFIFKIYFPKYLAEKAKNLATKEDIAEITNEIESVKSSYAHSLEQVRSHLQVKSALQQAFQSKCLETLVTVDELLIEIHLYCWKEIAERSPAEHYVWNHVNESKENRGFHYFRVAIDKFSMVHSLYLTLPAKEALNELACQIGCLSSMELHLSDKVVEDSASAGYEEGIEAVEKCRDALFIEFDIAK
ncbi:hypothetical protein GCM10007916_14280 [Psychromonas marina]|uniref:DUF4041 domain-containing protein n=1 Tax=Psychromonas marina TaxID=88364 RepID=A0ABQ6E023_9GAMM|nr:hypothetical protein [Psychromonas marina]GLS90361.1 hypothetical protein GCM10007916_14280 [Psychromonas marina]